MNPGPTCSHAAKPSTSACLRTLLLVGILAALPFLRHGGTALAAASPDFADVAAKIKPSIVGIGTLQRTRNPAAIFTGTGFAVADGRHVVTNAHVLPKELNSAHKETLAVLVPGENGGESRNAQVVAVDRGRDLALLRIEGTPLPALAIGDSETVREGQLMGFTGFPIGMALGLYPATHRATLAAIVPLARPGITARQLDPRLVSRLRRSSYVVFQLDATAYPGNSGSPLFDSVSAEVYGVINSVFIQGTREQAISRPSGITYAIPSVHIEDLLEQANLTSAR
jgi:serine protease Do